MLTLSKADAGSEEDLGWGMSTGQEEPTESLDTLLHGAGNHDMEQLHLSYPGLASDTVWQGASAAYLGSIAIASTHSMTNTGDWRTTQLPGHEASHKRRC